jgi:signal peptidase I
MRNEPEIRLTSSVAPAKRGSMIELSVLPMDNQPARLRLRGPASFSDAVMLRDLEMTGTHARQIRIYSTGRPGRVSLYCNGQRWRLRFEARGFAQSILYDWVPTIGLSVLLALVMRSFAFASYYVPSPSMEGTLYPGDKFIAQKFTTKVLKETPKRGEIVIFRHPENQNETWVKRVIGLPGDLVEIRSGKVWLNHEQLNESYVADDMLNDFGPVSVPEGNFFVLGDNRNNSLDSRYWGYLPREDIEGSPILIFWPPGHVRSLRRAKLEK